MKSTRFLKEIQPMSRQELRKISGGGMRDLFRDCINKPNCTYCASVAPGCYCVRKADRCWM